MALVAPRPSASVPTHTSVKPGVARKRRSVYLRSCNKRSTVFSHPYDRTSSRRAVPLPTAIRVARAASCGVKPRASNSALASEKKLSTSSAMSPSACFRRSRLRKPRASCRANDIRLHLCLQQTRNCCRAPLPLRCLVLELFSARGGEAVNLCAARVLRYPPVRVQPSVSLQTLQCRQERAGVHLENILGDLLDPPRYPKTVHRLQAQGFQDQHVECPLNDVCIGAVHRVIIGLQLLLLIVKI